MSAGPVCEEPPGQRSHCMVCGGTGMRVGLRVVWKRAREGLPPSRFWRRVADSEEAAIRMVELRGAGALEVECLSAAERCGCRAAALVPVVEEAAPDFKQLALGEREEV